MSYILDALRKSEQERRNQEVVDSFSGSMMTGPVHHASDRKYLLWVIAVLLVLVNASVLAFIFKDSLFGVKETQRSVNSESLTQPLDRSEQVQSPPNRLSTYVDVYRQAYDQSQTYFTSSVASEVSRQLEENNPILQPEVIRPQALSSTARNTHVISNDESKLEDTSGIIQRYRESQYQASQPKYDLINASSVPTTTPTSDLIEVLEDSEVIGPDLGSEMKSTVNSELSPDEISRLPRIRDLSSEQQASVPEIRFSGHLYSSKAESRSVRFGDAKYKEGDWLNNRIQLQRITEDGVIFELNGAAFYMSSLEDWLGY